MITDIITLLRYIVYVLIGFTVLYMILKSIEYKYKSCGNKTNTHNTAKKKHIKEIEIVSRDLYVKAENLIAMSEVYELQAEQLRHEIDNIEDMLSSERMSIINSDKEIKSLINKSLKLQERKCNLESKILKINNELTKIAEEEYKRQSL